MKQDPFKSLVKCELKEGDDDEKRHTLERLNHQLMLLVKYLTYLQTFRQPPPPEAATLRLLIVVVGLVLVIVALAATGAAEQVGEVLRYWPFMP